MKIINYNDKFSPRGDIATEMLKKIAETEPKSAFVLEWPANGSMPRFHTSTEDVPIICYRLQNFLNKIYSGEIELEIEEEENA